MLGPFLLLVPRYWVEVEVHFTSVHKQISNIHSLQILLCSLEQPNFLSFQSVSSLWKHSIISVFNHYGNMKFSKKKIWMV